MLKKRSKAIAFSNPLFKQRQVKSVKQTVKKALTLLKMVIGDTHTPRSIERWEANFGSNFSDSAQAIIEYAILLRSKHFKEIITQLEPEFSKRLVKDIKDYLKYLCEEHGVSPRKLIKD